MKPQNPYRQRVDDEAGPAVEHREDAAAEQAMTSDDQAFAGSADGVGSVGFDESGAFGVGARVEKGAPEGSEERSETPD